MAQKSLCVTYFLWLVGGVFGLHHFYLGRDFQALIWWMFCGGYFGAGLLRDLWRIPEYVRDANNDPSYLEQLAEKMRASQIPNNSYVRNFGQFIVSDAFGHLMYGAIPFELIPEYLHQYVILLTVPLAVSIGVYLVGNVGRHEGELLAATKGAYLTIPVYFIIDLPIGLTSFASCFYFNTFSKRWRRTPPPKQAVWRRLRFLSICGLIYLSLWGSWFYFNCSVTKDQEQVKCRDAAKHFFKSPICQEFIYVMTEIWRCLHEQGWREVWRITIAALDPTGETNALRVLGLKSTVTQQEITLQYRKLSRTWHPDKHQDPVQKQIAEEKFIEIQQAYEILSKIKSQRVAQNVKDPQHDSEKIEL
ncbi:dnaJ homolog subfamily C member 22 [Parasteatoda tepidariorum]|uniref:dnaJ homolog subfamily C member 22 n=1 Tax=Parasteatoda tepidariorum TaxID=114398 RepID=UPI00077FB1C8|nr:dnaJ homolog subfamily C member 22 [Parasteatoda tepidariorum]